MGYREVVEEPGFTIFESIERSAIVLQLPMSEHGSLDDIATSLAAQGLEMPAFFAHIEDQ